MPLIARASIGLIAAIAGTLVVTAILAVAPVMTSDEDLETSTIRYWWARLAPRSYAPRALERATFFFASPRESYCSHPEDLSTAWATILTEPAAESIYASLVESGSPAGRLYAMAGLAALGSGLVDSVLRRATEDTATVRVFTGSMHRLHTTTVAGAVAEDPVTQWAAMLRELAARKCAA